MNITQAQLDRAALIEDITDSELDEADPQSEEYVQLRDKLAALFMARRRCRRGLRLEKDIDVILAADAEYQQIEAEFKQRHKTVA